jgi:hypothetical protein
MTGTARNPKIGTDEYLALGSLREYVLIEVERASIDLFRRKADGNWVLDPTGGDEELMLAVFDFLGRWPSLTMVRSPAEQGRIPAHGAYSVPPAVQEESRFG